MLVTAIITTYKRHPDLVERAIKSVLIQTYKKIETIVVDDSPNDYEYRNWIKVMVEKYVNCNVKYIAMPKNSGACAARNMGLRYANGEYVAFLDDDDEWLPEKIEKQIKILNKMNVALVYCGWKVLYEGSNNIRYVTGPGYIGDVNEKLWLKGNFIGSTSFPLIRTSVLRELNGFDINMPAAQDYDLWLRIASKYPIGYVREILAVYHYHSEEQITKNPIKKIIAIKLIMRKHHRYLSINPRLKAVRRLGLIHSYIMAKKYKMAILLWCYSLINYPSNIKGNTRGMGKIVEALFSFKI